jgi:hypothetical protein
MGKGVIMTPLYIQDFVPGQTPIGQWVSVNVTNLHILNPSTITYLSERLLDLHYKALAERIVIASQWLTLYMSKINGSWDWVDRFPDGAKYRYSELKLNDNKKKRSFLNFYKNNL